jgi:hypothetical protein
MKKEFNIEKFKEDNGIIDYRIGDDYEIYKSYFPKMNNELFYTLDKNGMLGRLFKGLPIDLTKENIHIPFCRWRNDEYKQNKIQVPCVKKQDRNVDILNWGRF